MAATGGFVGARNMGDKPIIQKFEVATAADKALFLNDPVELFGSGQVTVATANSVNVIGVCVGLEQKNPDGTSRPLTFSQPTNGPYLTTGQAGFAHIQVNDNQLYLGTIDVSASAGLIGQNVNTSAGGANTNLGISGHSFAGSTLTASAGNQFKIVDILQNQTENLDGIRGDLPADRTVVVAKLNGGGFFNKTTGV